MSALVALAMVVLLAMAASRDVATRTIPDCVSLILAVMGVLVRMSVGPVALGLSVATTLMLFVVLLVIYWRGLIGGGDVKIMSALAIGLSPLDVYRFTIATAIAGGILAIAYLLLSLRPYRRNKNGQKSLFSRVAAVEAWRIRRRGPLPYGVAIAAGGAFVLFHPGSF